MRAIVPCTVILCVILLRSLFKTDNEKTKTTKNNKKQQKSRDISLYSCHNHHKVHHRVFSIAVLLIPYKKMPSIDTLINDQSHELASPLKVKGRNHVIKFKKNAQSSALNKARHAIKKHLPPLPRGRSVERRNNDSKFSNSFRRSRSSRGSQSRGRSVDGISVGSTKSNIMERLKLRRRDRSVTSVRSNRSIFSVNSTRSHRGGIFGRFFRRFGNNQCTTPTGETILFDTQEYIPHTAPSTPDNEESPKGPLDSVICSSFDGAGCKNLFCSPEQPIKNGKTVRYDDDPRYFGEEEDDDDCGLNEISPESRHAKHNHSQRILHM